jgi:S-adenosyl-L-methionine hydrolase (adenosine-forming)
VITLSSDFDSFYPAAMKGAILSRCDARLIDVSHELPRQNVRAGAFWLRELLPTFPPAVHLVVIDPGVGTDRKALIVRAGGHALVGPDNGVLLPVARALTNKSESESEGTDGERRSFETFEWHADDPASRTFHGRDVFAPAAARIHEAGIASIEGTVAATPTEEVVDLSFPDPTVDTEVAIGEVLVVDGFGNCVTNVPGTVLDGRYGDELAINGELICVGATYATVDPGTRLVTVGSHGNVELAVNRGRGDEAFDLGSGTSVRIDR